MNIINTFTTSKFNNHIMSKRSSPYPSSTIEDSLDFSSKIYKVYGSSYRATREEIAKALNYSSGSLNLKVSSAVQYGLLDLKSKEGYLVSDLFVRWNRPISEEDKSIALIDMFRNPSLYSEVLESFEGNILPPVKPLANVLLQKHNISESACDKAASVFEENAVFINALSSDRRLILDNGIDSDEEIPHIEVGSNIKTAVVEIPHEQERGNQDHNYKNPKEDSGFRGFQDSIPYNIPLKGKRPAQLLVPNDIQSRDFEFIIDFITLMKRQYE